MRFTILLVLAAVALAIPSPRGPGSRRPVGGGRGRPRPIATAIPSITTDASSAVATTELPRASTEASAAVSTTDPSPAATAAPSTGAGTIAAATIPDFGITPGIQSSSQPGSCVGNNNVNIPCACPPTKEEFAVVLSTFAARGKAGNSEIDFSTDFSDQNADTNSKRIRSMIIALQNLNFDQTGNAGSGCPVAAAPNFQSIQAQLGRGESVTIG